MAVFPAGSRTHVPPSWRPLMFEPDSPIIDFYPTNFRIDLNGKKWEWMGEKLSAPTLDFNYFAAESLFSFQ